MPPKENEKRQLTRKERQFRRIMTTLAVVALVALLIGVLVGMLIGFSCGKDKYSESKDPLMTTAYASGEEIEAIPLDYNFEWTELGEFTCYAYDACTACCGKSDGITKSGKVAKAGRTIAVDPSVIPLGSIVEIDGVQYTAEDTGGNIKGKVIDIYFDTHAEALDYGKQSHSVKILK